MQPHPVRSSLATFVPLLLLVYLLSTSLADPLPDLGVYNAKRVLQTLILSVLPALALLSRPLRQAVQAIFERIPVPVLTATVLLTLLVTLSSLRVPLSAYALAENGLLALVALTALIVAASRKVEGARFDRIVLGGLAALSVAVALQELMGVAANWSLGLEFSYGQMFMHFAHPRFFNQLQSWMMPLLGALPLVFGDRSRVRGLTLAALGLGWCVLLMSGGRGSMISVIAALTLIALLAPWKSSRRWAGLHAGGLALGLALITLISVGNARFAPAGGEFIERSVGRPLFHTTGRTHLWGIAWSQARSRPWLGIGTGYYNCGEQPVVAAHPHSFPLQIVAEWGIPATLLVVGVFLWLLGLLMTMLRQRGPPEASEAGLFHLLCASLIAAAVHAGASGVLLMPASQLMAALVGGWLLGVATAPGTRSTHMPPSSLAAAAVLACALLGGGAIAVFSWHEVRTLPQRVQFLAEAGVARPRYWQYGQICRYSH